MSHSHDHHLHDDHPSFAQRFRTTVIVLLLSVVPILAIFLTLRYTLEPYTRGPALRAFSTSFLSILFEAIPFVLLGALVSGLIEVFVPPQTLLRLIPRSRIAQLAIGATAGVFLPVCECGVIVVLRRLMRKGMPLPMALAYMLVAPIVNPVVIASTFAAYRAFPTWLLVPFGRIGLGVLLGMVIAAFVGRDRFRRLVRDNAQPDPLPGHAASGDHHHHAPLSRKLSAVADHAVAEFLDVAVFLIAGAAVAAFVQTFVSRAILVNVGHSPVLAVPVMMALAVLLNLCSEADAFVAASFSATFSVASQLAFLVLGPMLDLKLIIMYTMVFRRQLILILVPTILVVIFLAMQAFALAEYLFRAAPGASP